jgi:hypothetical protein
VGGFKAILWVVHKQTIKFKNLKEVTENAGEEEC